MGAAWGWWEGPDPLQMFPPSNQAALLTSCSSAFAFQWHRANSWRNKLQSWRTNVQRLGNNLQSWHGESF